MRVTLKAIHDELQRLGHDVRLEKDDGYFFFWCGEAEDWLDKTVRVPTLGQLTLEQWVGEFNRLKKLNAEIRRGEPKLAEKNPNTTAKKTKRKA